MSNEALISKYAPELLSSPDRSKIEALMSMAREEQVVGRFDRWDFAVSRATNAFMGCYNMMAEKDGRDRIGWPGTMYMEAAVLAALRVFGLDHKIHRGGIVGAALTYHDTETTKCV